MPGKVKVRVMGARHLPVMDRSSENTDAFAEVRFADYPPHKTEVCRKSLNPVWNSEVFKFEVADDSELQDEPLQIRVMDYDTYSANDAIGKVYIDLNPLLLWPRRTSIPSVSTGHPKQEDTPAMRKLKAGATMMSGWLPIYDTLHGIRGEVNVIVKVELFSDFNQFRQSSCGVPIYSSSGVPEGYRVKNINGFVEELVVNDDPEYQWIDKIRTPRASNEARQTLFMKLSGAVKRKIGLKALELGGNAVVGYQQKFDVEGDTGIVVRGIGTAMTLVRSDLQVNAFLGHKELSAKDVCPPKMSSIFNAFSEFCSQSSHPPQSPSLDLLATSTLEMDKETSKDMTRRSGRSTSLAVLSPSIKQGHKRVTSLTSRFDIPSNSGDSMTSQALPSKIGCISESSFMKSLRLFGGDVIARPRSYSARKISEELDDQDCSVLLESKESHEINGRGSSDDCTDEDRDQAKNFLKISHEKLQQDYLGLPKFSLEPPTPTAEEEDLKCSKTNQRSCGSFSLSSNLMQDHPLLSNEETNCQFRQISDSRQIPIAASLDLAEERKNGSLENDNFLQGRIKDSPELEITGSGSPKIFSFGTPWNERAMLSSSSKYSNRMTPLDGVDLLEYPFITLKKFPPGFIHRVGGLVSCRAVKLLDGLEEDGDTRDGWWVEIRQEVRSHARCLGCNVVIGYSEDTVIWDEVVVLCASGTAAVADLNFILDLDSGAGIFGPPFLPNPSREGAPRQYHSQAQSQTSSGGGSSCSHVHIPYADSSLPYGCRTAKCALCGKGRVPDVLFSTIEPPANYEVTGRGCLIHAKVLRLKKDLKGEHNAKEISDALPFIEYEIHRQLMNKLKVKGMNALFGLKTTVSIGDRTVIGSATATACFLSALPVPSQPKLVCTSAWKKDPKFLQRMQKKLEERVAGNERHYGLGKREGRRCERGEEMLLLQEGGDAEGAESNRSERDAEEEEEEEEVAQEEKDFSPGHKDLCVLEIDDSEDVDILDSLMDPFPPPLIQVFSTEDIIGISPGLAVSCCQTFAQRSHHPSSRDLSSACQRILSAIYFKLRKFRPCILTRINFQADLNEENELQLCVYGTAIALSKGSCNVTAGTASSGVANAEEPSQKEASSISSPNTRSVMIPSKSSSPTSPNPSASSPQTKFFADVKSLYAGINLTPLSYVPGAKIEKYLGGLNFFLIRETSSLREFGGLNTFIQAFLSEVFSIVRSHVHALGGNALVAFFMSEFVVNQSPHKNQCQCLLHVGGDVVSASYLTFPAAGADKGS